MSARGDGSDPQLVGQPASPQANLMARCDLRIHQRRLRSFDVVNGEGVGIIGHNSAAKKPLPRLSRIAEPTGERAIIGSRVAATDTRREQSEVGMLPLGPQVENPASPPADFGDAVRKRSDEARLRGWFGLGR